MENTFRVEIYTPRELFFYSDAQYLNVSGIDGGYGIMKNHISAVIALKEGCIEVTTGGTRQRFISGVGYLEVKDNLAKIFVAECKKEEEKAE